MLLFRNIMLFAYSCTTKLPVYQLSMLRTSFTQRKILCVFWVIIIESKNNIISIVYSIIIVHLMVSDSKMS